MYAAQAIPPIDAEIAEKGHLWTENRLFGSITAHCPTFRANHVKGATKGMPGLRDHMLSTHKHVPTLFFFDFLDLSK